jgi:hypothetical protein
MPNHSGQNYTAQSDSPSPEVVSRPDLLLVLYRNAEVVYSVRHPSSAMSIL